MEIHSSSLTSIPAGFSDKNKKDGSAQLNNTQIKDNQQNQTPLSLPSAKANEDNFKTTDFKKLSDDIEKQKNAPTNSRTARAVNAYIQENTQLLKSQRSELVSGIDFFA